MSGHLHKRATTLLGASNRQRSDIGGKIHCLYIVVMLIEEFFMEQPRGNIPLVSIANNLVNYLLFMGCLLQVFVKVLSLTWLGFQ